MNLVHTASALLFLFVAGGAAAADAPLTLEEARRAALANHPLVRAADLTRQASAARVTIARSYYYPQLGADAVRAFANPSTRIGATGGLNDPTIIDRGSLGLGLSQLITDFGRTSALVDSSKLDLQAQTERVALTQEQVLLNVTAAYFGVLRAEALVRVADQTRASRQSLLDQVQGLRDAALRSDLDLSIAKQGVADADLLLLRARTAIDDGYASLAEAMGSPSQDRPALNEAFDTPPPPTDLTAVQGLASDHNPALRALADDVAAAQKKADAEARDRYPTINAVGYAGVTPQRDPLGTIKQNYAAGGFTLDVPLFQGGRLSAKQDEARLAAESLQQRYDSEKNILSRDVSIAFGNTRTAFDNISVTDQLVQNARQTLDLTQARYNIGQSSIVDLNQAQLTATQAEIAHEEAIFDYRMQRARLDYETGDLAAEMPPPPKQAP